MTARRPTLSTSENLFTGAVWTGRQALALGLVDALGDVRATMRARFGDRVEYELPFGPDKPFLKEGVLGQIVGGWRIAGVHAYASGYPLTVLPGYGLPLNAGDNRITVLDYHDWRAATQGGSPPSSQKGSDNELYW